MKLTARDFSTSNLFFFLSVDFPSLKLQGEEKVAKKPDRDLQCFFINKNVNSANLKGLNKNLFWSLMENRFL